MKNLNEKEVTTVNSEENNFGIPEFAKKKHEDARQTLIRAKLIPEDVPALYPEYTQEVAEEYKKDKERNRRLGIFQVIYWIDR